MTLPLFLLLFSVAVLSSVIGAVGAVYAGVVDLPGGRRTHIGAIPRVGGVAVFIPLLLLLPTLVPSSGLYFPLALGVGGLCLLGTLDDAFGLSPLLRLVIEGALSFLVLRPTLPSARASELVLLLLFTLALINSANFLDGIDALLLCLALPPLLALSLASATVAPIALAVCALLLGFLPWNLPRARIFLGDGGSTTIGFLLAYLAIVALYCDSLASDAGVFSARLPLFLLLFFVFWLDLALTVGGRILRGVSPFHPDRTHIHHRLSSLVSERAARLLLLSLSLLSSLLFLLFV